MFARLWWKEYRVFGPVWLILALAAGLLQWLFSSTGSMDSKAGALTVYAVSWAVLYAFASGAAAFAGERESRTLGFLDALPVGRWTLWTGKASFSLASTFTLALLLAGMAALGTESRDPVEIYGYEELTRVFGTILFEAVAWSLLWSSLSGNALLAGVMGVLSVYASAALITVLPGMDLTLARNDFVPQKVMPARLLAALAALAVSGLVMAWRPKAPRSSIKVAVPPPSPTPTIRLRTSSAGRSLAWQARREGWTTWVFVGLVGLILPVVASSLGDPFDGLIDLILAVLASLVAGVSVFGVENASGGRRFLVQHGVAPGTVWWRKVLVWGVAMGSIACLSLYALWSFHTLFARMGGVERLRPLVLLGLALLNAFAVGLLCGMTITRRITAAMVGVIVLIAVLPLQIGTAGNAMVPAWSVFLVPLTFIAASRARAGDWLLEREGVRPWLRLGAWLAVPLAALGMAYVGYRAFGLPDVGPQFVGANLLGAPIPPEQDAAEAYRRAVGLIAPEANLFFAEHGTISPSVEGVIDNGWDWGPPEVVAYWKSNRAAIEQARRASAMPRARFEDVGRLTYAWGEEKPLRGLQAIDQLLALDARERLGRGDLAGAWGDILAQFRMAGQLGADSPTETRMTLAARVHHRAVGLAFDWLGAPGQATDTLGRALADLMALPAPPDLASTMQAESSIIERTLDLSGDELAGLLLPAQYHRKPTTLEHLWFARIIAAPWERERARRAGRLLIARGLPEVVLEPVQRGPIPDLWSLGESNLLQGWTLTRSLLPFFQGTVDLLDREVVGRRALEQAIAVEAWKVGHDGQYPATLEALVPGFLPRLPLDPYSGKPFRFIRSDGRSIPPPIFPERDPLRTQRPTRAGQPLLYSVGRNRTDDGGQGYPDPNQADVSDLVFPIP